MARLGAWIGGGVVALTMGLLVLLASIGWFGGPLFIDIPAAAAPAPAESGLAAVVLSGDMGFHIGMAAKIARRLAARDIPTVGVNSLTFFRRPRTAEATGDMLGEAIARALRLSKGNRVVLVGESLGADALHVGLSRLRPEMRAKVSLVALVVPGTTVQLQATPSGVVRPSAPLFDALPTARALDWAPALCIRGRREPDSLCTRLAQPNMTRVDLPGGHLLRGDAALLAATLLRAIDQADGRAWPRR